MNLTKLAAPAVIILSSLSMISCDGEASKADKQLSKLAQQSTSTDPTVKYQDKTLTYRYTVASDIFSRINSDSLKKKTRTELITPENEALVKALATAGADVRYVYVCDSDSISFSFSPADLTK